MDAVKFVREEIRMCAEYENCCDCPLGSSIYCSVSPKKRSQEEAEEIVSRVESWSAEHPRKTRQSVFLEQYPHAYTQYGVIEINPCRMVRNYTYKDCNITDCLECRKEFWNQEVE